MALITTLPGIVQTADKTYEVTSVVNIGSGIDNVTDATFIMKDGGLLRWVSGCTTTFTRCVFFETFTAQALGPDNFNSGAVVDDFPNNVGKARFHETGDVGDPTLCKPVFKGCTWQVWTATRSDFDVGLYPAAAGPTFERDVYGQPCHIYLKVSGGSQFNHFASDEIRINGLVVNHTTSSTGAYEFSRISSDTTRIKDLSIVNYAPTNTGRHCVVLMQNVPSGSDRTIKELTARNIALYGGDPSRVIRLVDTIGYLPSAEDSATSYASTAKYYRTFSTNYIDVVTTDPVETRTVFVKADNTIAAEMTGTDYEYELMQYLRVGGTIPLVDQGTYKLVQCPWGYRSQKSNITMIDTTNPDYYRTQQTALFKDPGISEQTRSTVGGYSTLSTSAQLYDYSKYLEQTRVDYPEYIGEPFVTTDGPTLDFGDHNVIIDPTLPRTMVHVPADKAPGGTPGISTLNSISFTDEINKDTGLEILQSGLMNAIATEAGVDYTTLNWFIASSVWKPDGTKLFLHVGATNNDAVNSIVQYNLSTPYDLSTATLHGFYRRNINGQPCDFWIHPDGDRIILAKRWGRWYYATMSTPWDITTMPANWSNHYNYAAFDRASNVFFNADGTKMWSILDGGNYSTRTDLRQWTLSTPWDITTMGSTTSRLIPGTVPYNFIDNSYQRVVKWWYDGKYLTMGNAGGSATYFREMTTPYDMDEITAVTDFEIISHPVLHNSKTVTSLFRIAEGDSKLMFHYHSDDNGTFKMQYRDIAAEYIIGGATNTVYINSSNLASDKYTTIKTTATVSFLNGAATGMQVIDVNGVLTSVTINGITPNTEIRMYRASDDVEIAGIENSVGNTASLNYTYTTPEQYYIIIHNERYTTSPRYIEFTTQSAPASLTVFQQIDRAYSNP